MPLLEKAEGDGYQKRELLPHQESRYNSVAVKFAKLSVVQQERQSVTEILLSGTGGQMDGKLYRYKLKNNPHHIKNRATDLLQGLES